MWPHSAHRRRWNHQPPDSMHSTQPVPLGGTSGSMKFVITQGTGVRTVLTPLPTPRHPPLARRARSQVADGVGSYSRPERYGKVRDKDGDDVRRPDPGPVGAEADDFAIGSLERVALGSSTGLSAYVRCDARARAASRTSRGLPAEPTVSPSTKTSNRPRLSSIPKPSSWVTLSVADTALPLFLTAERLAELFFPDTAPDRAGRQSAGPPAPNSARPQSRAPLNRVRSHLRKADPVLARLIDARPTFDPQEWLAELPSMDLFGSLLFQVAGQQLSVAATRALAASRRCSVVAPVPG